MNKDRIAGAAKELKGSVKEAAGKATGDAKLKAEGQGRQGRRQSPERRRRYQGYAEEVTMRRPCGAAVFGQESRPG